MQRRLHGGGANARNAEIDTDGASTASKHESSGSQVVEPASRSPCGIGFRRQHPIGPYSSDFYCPAAKLVIEVDGLIHDFAEQSEHDEKRNAYMQELGLRIIRIPASDVLRDADAAAGALVELCTNAAGPSTTQLR